MTFVHWPCKKCQAAKEQEDQEKEQNEQERNNVALSIKENENYIRKRKPVDFTMDDLVEDMYYLEDEEEVYDVEPTSIRTQPKRHCTLDNLQ